MAPPVQEIIGFWGKPTSTLDWCENNYEVSNFKKGCFRPPIFKLYPFKTLLKLTFLKNC